MSGIAGVWNVDGRPIERQVVSAIGSRIAHRGRDGRGAWFDTAIGFVAHLRHTAPQSDAETQPLTDGAGNTLALDGRLDNREELLRDMKTSGLTARSSDAALALAAFRTWGRECFARLRGEFAIAVFDSRERQLTLARDGVGCRPLYYCSHDQTFVFGSEIKAILAHPAVLTKPNTDLLADYFLRDRLPYEDSGETFFEGIHAVLPGRRVTVARGPRVASETFWDFDPQSTVRFRSYEDYAERLRELLIQAVARRLKTSHPAAIAVSGGLDSSIVLCIADDLKKHGAVDAPLLAVSCVSNQNEAPEEEAFIAALESSRRLRVNRIDMAPPGSRRDLEIAAWHSEWPHLDDGWCAQRPMFAWAAAHGARTIVTGHWSDQFFFVTGYLSDLFRTLEWRKIATHLDEYMRWFVDADPAYFRARFRRELMFTLTSQRLRRWLRPFSGSRVARRRDQFVSAGMTACLERPRLRLPRRPCRSAHARDIYQTVRAKSHRLQFEAYDKLAESCDVETTTPFLDSDVIAYLMSIPGEVQNRGGVPRALLRDSMRGIVPDVILQRRWRNDDLPVLDRQRAYLSSAGGLEAAHRLGFLTHPLVAERETIDFIGLDVWSRAFFSDRLTSPQPSPNGVGEAMDTAVKPRNDDREKLPYSPPRLTIHGDLRSLTAAKQSDRSEAGQPKTFNAGMP